MRYYKTKEVPMKTLILILTMISSLASAQGGKHTEGGRFQLIQLSDYRRDQYMIDSDTGKVWHLVCVSEAIKVTNGKDTLEVEPADLEKAKADGYNPIDKNDQGECKGMGLVQIEKIDQNLKNK